MRNYDQHFHLLSWEVDATTAAAIKSATPIALNAPVLTINEYVKHLFSRVIVPTRGMNNSEPENYSIDCLVVHYNVSVF